jgi:hypothetical protein
MDAPAFTIGQALRFGWEKTKEHLWFLISVILIVLVIVALPQALQAAIGDNHPVLSALIALSSIMLQFIVTLGVLRIALNIFDSKKADLSDLFDATHLFFKYLWASIIYCLICLGGLLLLIVPGIIWAIKYQFYPYFIVDQNGKGWESLKKSGAITHGHKWHLFGFGIVLVLINIAGLCALVVGVLVTAIISLNAVTFVYRSLVKAQQAKVESSSIQNQTAVPQASAQSQSIQDGGGI